MKKIFKSIIIVIVLISSGKINAQEFKNYKLYTQNPALYNPAFSVHDKLLNAYINTHLQWVGLTGAPKIYSFGASTSFNKKMGTGISIFNSWQDVVSKLEVKLQYACQINFSSDNYIKMGVSAGLFNDRLIVSEIQNIDITDDILNESNVNKTGLSVGFGLAYKFKDFDAQIILPQLYEYRTSNMYTIGIIGYNFDLGSNFELKPSVAVRGAKTSAIQFDGNIMITRNKSTWGQISFRSNHSFVFGFGINIGSFGIGYAYQLNTNAISIGSPGNNEIQLIINIDKKGQKCPAYSLITQNYSNKI